MSKSAVHESPANLTLGFVSTIPEQAIFIASSIFFNILSLHASPIKPMTIYPACLYFQSLELIQVLIKGVQAESTVFSPKSNEILLIALTAVL